MKIIAFTLLLISISFASGLSSITPRIVDEIYMIMIVGYDYENEDLIKETVVAPNYKADNTIENLSFTNTSSLVYENRDKLEAKSPRPLLIGKLEAALFNRELAEKGIMKYIDHIQRDPNVGSLVHLAIFDGNTEEILKKPFKDQPTGVYFSDLIEQNQDYDNLPVTNLHTFGYQYFAKGVDPVLPLLEEAEETKVNIKGVALFKQDKMLSEVAKKELFYFRGLYEPFNNGTHSIQFDNKERAFLSTIKSSRRFYVQNNQDEFNPKVNISLKMNGIIREYTGKTITQKNVKDFEQQVSKDIETKTNEMVKKFQEIDIDPIGIGYHVKHHTRNWDEKKWNDMYPTLHITVKVDFTILEHGMIK